ncbi:MAG TPA: DUF4446 family protein [Solirubrobacteraceae bacterium]|nr:DUF4446 family protein [Solirubrobacteraceae bacterium]
MIAAQVSTGELIAIVAGAVALVALASAAALALALRRLRRAQRQVLGEHGARDLVAQGAELQSAFETLRDYVDEIAQRLDGRLHSAEQRLEGAVVHRGLVRYDAYNELSGHQSLSIALLDSNRSGIVLTSIHHRDSARLYAKLVTAGSAELALSPEEDEALRLALEH